MKTPLLLALAALAYSPLSAQTSQPDTARTQTLEEALVVASPKEHALLRQMPASVSALEGEQLAENGVQAVKGLSAVAPNLYIPDYGSRLSSSLYVRGVGSRVGTPAVGLYVDDIPYADKSTFDFDFVDVARVEVLRGPQGTLYGRGAMGGLIKVYSAEPREDHRTRIGLGATTRITGRRVSASTSHKISDAFRLSLAAYYKGDNGFQRNSTTGRKADAQDAGGAALKADWRIGERWRTTFSADYQYADQRSNPYVYEGTAVEGGEEAFPALIGKISQNRQSNYRRSLVNAANKTEYLAPKVRLTNILAYQYLTDRLFMDQDYIAADIFSLEQKQWRNGVSDELSLKGELGRWQWTAGAFFLHEHKRTTCPVTFYGDGVAYLNGQFASVMPEFVSIAFSENEIPFFATLKSTGWNGAIFHQSTVRDLFAKGLSLTAGLRLDYDRHSLALQSSDQAYAYNFGLAMMGRTLSQDFAADALLSGDDHQTTWQLLPKIALDYQFDCGHVYATVAKGYRSGGYNLENYSDLSQAVLRRNMMLQVADYSEQTISALPLPEESKQRAISGMKGSILANLPEQPEIAALAYKPEFSWNYEVGAHLDFFEKCLALDAAVFLANRSKSADCALLAKLVRSRNRERRQCALLRCGTLAASPPA